MCVALRHAHQRRKPRHPERRVALSKHRVSASNGSLVKQADHRAVDANREAMHVRERIECDAATGIRNASVAFAQAQLAPNGPPSGH